MNWHEIEPHLAPLTKEKLTNWQYLERCDSTNQQLLDMACHESVDGFFIIADEQTKGRGRNDKAWISDKNEGLLFSYGMHIDDNDLPNRRIDLLSLIVGVSVCQALIQLGLQPKLKWPNDVMLNKAKLAGILIESQYRKNKGMQLVIGVGINLFMPSKNCLDKDYHSLIDQAVAAAFPPSRENQSSKNMSALRLKTLSLVLDALLHNLVLFESSNAASFLDKWRQFDFFSLGEVLMVDDKTTKQSNEKIFEKQDDWQEMIYQGIDESGNIKMTRANGVVATFNSADIKIKKTW